MLAVLRVLNFTGLLWLLCSNLGGWQLTKHPFNFKEIKPWCYLLAPTFWMGRKALPSVLLELALLSNACAVAANLRYGVGIACPLKLLLGICICCI